MTSPRRIGGPDAKNRGTLLDAAEQIMLQEGYAAVTSRRVADRAGLKSQLVHYYFRSMDDLFLAILHRRGELAMVREAEMTAGDRPLRALWEFSADPTDVRITMEFVGLAGHRPAIRAEVSRYARKFRARQIEAIAAVLRAKGGAGSERVPAAALAVLMTSVARVLVMEQALGVDEGHAEVLELVERELEALEPNRTADAT